MKNTIYSLQGGRPVRLDDFQRSEDDKNNSIYGIGEMLGHNHVLSGCVVTTTPVGANVLYTITSGICYVIGWGICEFKATSFTSTFTNPALLKAYMKNSVNPLGTLTFSNQTSHDCWIDNEGIFLTADQPLAGLTDVGYKSSFYTTLPATYALKASYDATAATVAAIPSIYQTIAGMSSYTTNAVATATYRRISDSYTKADVNSLLTPLETTSHASSTYQKIASMSNYYTKTEINSKLPTLIVMGYIATSATSATVRKAGLVSSLGCSKISTGRYTITHNYGSMNYMVFANCVAPSGTAASIKVGSIGKGYNSFEIILGDDTTANDSAFDFIMYSF